MKVFHEHARPKKFDNDIKSYALFCVKLKTFSIPKSIKLKSDGIKVSPSILSSPASCLYESLQCKFILKLV